MSIICRVFPGDKLPETAAGGIVGIADKLDNIIATFSRGMIPSGSQDPFALRRQALGIVNILIKAGYHLSLQQLADIALDLLAITDLDRRKRLKGEIFDFFRLRLKNVLADEGIRYDLIDAVMAVETDDIYDTWLRANALSLQGGSAAMQTTVQALTRAGNLAKNATVDKIDPSLFETDAEKNLYQVFLEAERQIATMTTAKNYNGVLEMLARLAAPIDAFFSQVMVMVEVVPVRSNRLALLKAITGLTSRIADLGKIIIAN